MNTTGFPFVAGAMPLLITLSLVLLPELAVAADPTWRPTYDVAMRWINFVLLVGVIVKYGREPIRDFLQHRKEDVVAQIDELDGQKNRVLEEIREAKQQAESNRARFEKMKTRLIAQGEARKQQIVAQAQQQSALMLEETRRKMENRVLQAKAGLTVELVDMAIEQAMHRLPELMTDGDNQRMLDEYMQRIAS